MANPEVKSYYNKISKEYDSSRFDNTYGKFIDNQERSFLDKHVDKTKRVLNLGCGTGRFMDYTSDGLDFSSEMMEVAREKFPEKEYCLSDADTTPYENDTFDEIICFHVIMHLTKEKTEDIFREVNRILKPGGKFIFDYPSSSRRKLTNYKSNNWHGGNGFSKKSMKNLWSNNWKHHKSKGVLFLPIHRFPKGIRKVFYGIDQLLTISPFKHYSSYIIQSLTKNKL